MTVLVYDSKQNRMERYSLELFEPMPYTYGSVLSVAEFRGNSQSNLLWTTLEAMSIWNKFTKKANFFNVFCRIWEGGHVAQSAHYAGIAFDTDCEVSFPYIEFHPDAVHLSLQSSYGYPTLSRGSIGVYVLILQDALQTLGFSPEALDGFFGPLTERAVLAFARSQGFPENGVVIPELWNRLTFLAAGAGAPIS